MSSLLRLPAEPADVALAAAPERAAAGDARFDELRADTSHAVRNAAKLAASLLLTWSVALVVRVILPRFLGPEVFGQYQFAESFTVMLFLLTNFGVDTYIRTAVSRDGAHASDFVGGVLVMRAIGSTLLIVGATAALAWVGKPSQVRDLVIVMGVVQAMVLANQLAAAMLQAVGRVDGLAAVNVGAKVLWGVGILVGLAGGLGVLSVAVGLLASEILRALVLWRLSRRHLGLRLRVDAAATKLVLAASAPFFIKDLAFTASSRMDVGIMSFIANDFEVGWYGVAANIAGLAMLLTPIIASVFLPLSSRAAARSEEDVAILSRRAMHYTLAVAIPVTLGLALGADFLVDRVFGHRFAPSAPTLRVLAPTFVLTYVAMLTSLVLMAVGRGWTLTKVALSALVVTPLLHLVLIPWGLERYGAGGAGVGAAAATVVSELYLAALMAWMVRRFVFDRAGVEAVAKMLLVTAGVVALHVLLAPLGHWRLVADALVYVAAVQLWGAVDFRVIVRSVRLRAPVGAEPA